jgi:hypothetical protein
VGFGSTITDNVVTYLTYLDVDNADLSLRPGMTATATITATERKDVLLVPNRRCASRPPTAAGTAGACGLGRRHHVEPDAPHARRQRAQRRPPGASTAGAGRCGCCGRQAPQAVAVTPGISDGRMTEITGGDLQEGMQVITDQNAAPGDAHVMPAADPPARRHQALRQRRGRADGTQGHRPGHRGRRVRRHHGPQRLGQVHRDEHPGLPGHAHRRAVPVQGRRM